LVGRVIFALKELGYTEAECIIASDDECFTYNARVNRLNPIAEHKMITKAVQNGVRPERIAAALNLTVREPALGANKPPIELVASGAVTRVPRRS